MRPSIKIIIIKHTSKDKTIVFSIFTEVLSADRVLASEIEFDLQKFEEQQAELARQKKAPSSVQVLEL